MMRGATIATVMALLALTLSAAPAAASPELDRILSALAGRSAHMECKPKSQILGKVGARAWPTRRLVEMDTPWCRSLLRLAARPSAPPAWADATAVFVLAHEAAHIFGIADEAQANCRGIQTYEQAWLLLGLRPAYARAMVDANWEGVYASFAYHSPECRNGGKLDLRPRSARWP